MRGGCPLDLGWSRPSGGRGGWPDRRRRRSPRGRRLALRVGDCAGPLWPGALLREGPRPSPLAGVPKWERAGWPNVDGSGEFGAALPPPDGGAALGPLAAVEACAGSRPHLPDRSGPCAPPAPPPRNRGLGSAALGGDLGDGRDPLLPVARRPVVPDRRRGHLGGEESAPEVVLQTHTGELWGLVGRAIACIAALAVLAMIWTGATSALRRR